VAIKVKLRIRPMSFEELRSWAISEWSRVREEEETPYILVGAATCGRAAGALSTLEAFEQELERQGVEARVIQTGCMGSCSLEPIVAIKKSDMPLICYSRVTEALAVDLARNYLVNDDPCLEIALGTVEWDDDKGAYVPEMDRFEHEQRLLLRRCGYIDPANIGDYVADGGYGSLDKALGMSPEAIIKAIKDSGLRGKGGGGFPTGLKWELARKAPGQPKYVVCNADEGDPGAFMDRVLLESDPHQALEGMIIAGYALGTRHGYIYIRSEYPLAIERLRTALSQAEELGLLGENILGSKFSFHVDIVEGAGAFVCGESSALMYSIEGKRGMPRVRPPRSVDSGLLGKPTLLNNVKTFASVPLILARGPDWYAGIGTEGSKGTALFCLAGSVVNTGLVEVPMGTTLREVVFDIGGGVPEGKQFKAVQVGGPSGGCVPDTLLDTPVDFDSLKHAGAMMGSGGMIVMDEGNCAVDVARFFLDFSQKESCGKCTMCRLGTRQLLDILDDITKGQGQIGDLELLVNLSEDVRAGSLCGLGKTAPNPLLTTLAFFWEEYRAHILEKRCPALVCKELISYYIVPVKCQKGCDHCKLACPSEAISDDEKGLKVIDQTKCVKCGACLQICPPEYGAVIKVTGKERYNLGLVPVEVAPGGV
jgi:NADH-quinone oxidoreductase subunit F